MKKKKLLLGALVATASLVLLTGCVKKNKKTSTDTGTTPVTTNTGITPPTVTPTVVPPVTETEPAVTTGYMVQGLVTYNTSGGTLPSSVETTVTVEYDSRIGVDYTIISNVPYKSGYRFLGWKVAGDDNLYASGATYHINEENESPIFVAQFVKQVYLRIYSGIDGSSPFSEKYDVNQTIQAPDYSVTRPNYAFMGYATTNGGAVVYNVGDDIKIEETDISLFAVWTANPVTVNFHLKNYTYFNKDTTVNTTYGNTVTMPDYDLSTYSGLQFLGWSKTVFNSTAPTDFKVDYKGGEVVSIDELPVTDGVVDLYGCYINPSSHVYDSGVIAKNATLEKDGLIKYTCTSTGHTDSRYETISKSTIFATRIDAAFTIESRGTVATTTIEQGTINVGDAVKIMKFDGTCINSVVTGIEINKNTVDSASAGSSCGLLLRSVNKDDLMSGMLIVKNDDAIISRKVLVSMHMHSKEEGGRLTPIFSNYGPDMLLGNPLTYTGEISIGKMYNSSMEEIEMVMPGQDAFVELCINTEDKYYPMWAGLNGILRGEGITFASFTIVERLDSED